jgi:hypothetical protein
MVEPLALFALELHRPCAVAAATWGHFTDTGTPDAREVVLVRQGGSCGSTLECWSYQSSLGKLQRVEASGAGVVDATFARVGNLATWRIANQPDLLVVVADSGVLSVLSWQSEKAEDTAEPSSGWMCLTSAVFSKPGTRANRPGSFLAIDEQGQACVIAALDGTLYAFTMTTRSAEKSLERAQPRRRTRSQRQTTREVTCPPPTAGSTERSSHGRRFHRQRKRPVSDTVDVLSDGRESESELEGDAQVKHRDDPDDQEDDEDAVRARTTWEVSAPMECLSEETAAFDVCACLGLVAVSDLEEDQHPQFVMLADGFAPDAASGRQPVKDRRLMLVQVDCKSQTMQQSVASEPLVSHAYGLYSLADRMVLVVTLTAIEVWQLCHEASAADKRSSFASTLSSTGSFQCLGKTALPNRVGTALPPKQQGIVFSRDSFFALASSESSAWALPHVLITAAVLWESASSDAYLYVILGDEDGCLYLLTIDFQAATRARPQAVLSYRFLQRMPAPVSAFCFLTSTDVLLVMEEGEHVVLRLPWPPKVPAGAATTASSLSDDAAPETTLAPGRESESAPEQEENTPAKNRILVQDTLPCHHPVTTSLLVPSLRVGSAQERPAQAPWHLLCGSAGTRPSDTPLWTVMPARDTVALAQCPVNGRAQRLFTLPWPPEATISDSPDTSYSNPWTCTEEVETLLLVSFTQETQVYRFQDLRLDEAPNLGFAHDTSTIHAGVLFGGEPAAAPCWVQVHDHGVRLVPLPAAGSEKALGIEVYATSTAQQHIVAADSTVSQLLLLLADGQLVYLMTSATEWPSTPEQTPKAGANATPLLVGFGPSGVNRASANPRTRTTSPVDTPSSSPTFRALACCLSPPEDNWSSFMAYIEAGNPATLCICRLPGRSESVSVQPLYNIALSQPAASMLMVQRPPAAVYDLWIGCENGSLLRLEAVDLSERRPSESGPTPRIRSYALDNGALRLHRVRVPRGLGTEAMLVLGTGTWMVPCSSRMLLWSNPYPVNMEALLDVASFALPQGRPTIDPAEQNEAIAVFPAATALAALSSEGRMLQLFCFSETDSIRNALTFRPVVPMAMTSNHFPSEDQVRHCVRKLCWILPNRLAAVASSTESNHTWQTQLSLCKSHHQDDAESEFTPDQASSPWLLLQSVQVMGERAWPRTYVTAMTSIPASRSVSNEQETAPTRFYLVVALAPAPTGELEPPVEEMSLPCNALLLTFLVERQDRSNLPWKLTLADRLAFPEPIGAMEPFLGHLLIAHGHHLALYGRTSHTWQPLVDRSRPLRHPIVALATNEETRRIFVADLQEGVHLFKHYPEENRLAVVAEDTQRRWIHRLHTLDADTVVIADKFGTISVLRLWAESSAAIEDDPSCGRLAERYFGHPQLARPWIARFVTECVFQLGSVVTSLQAWGRSKEHADGSNEGRPECSEGILYGTIDGAFGMLVPFRSTAEWEMMKHLEAEMMTYWTDQGRSSHAAQAAHRWNLLHSSVLRFHGGGVEPARHVVNGQLCGLFLDVEPELQQRIAGRVLGLREPFTVNEAHQAVALLVATLERLYERVLLLRGK